MEDTNFSDLVGGFKHNTYDDCKSLQYSGLIPALVKSIQEQQTIIETQQTTIDDFKTTVDDLKSRIETLEG